MYSFCIRTKGTGEKEGERGGAEGERKRREKNTHTARVNAKKMWIFLRLILHNADAYEKHQRKKEFPIIFHGRYNEKKRLVALKRAQAHRGARASPELLYHLIFCYYCCCCLCPMPFLSLCMSTYASHKRAREDFCMYPFCLFICMCVYCVCAWARANAFFDVAVVAVAHLVRIREQILVLFYRVFLLFCITTTIILSFYFVCTPKCWWTSSSFERSEKNVIHSRCLFFSMKLPTIFPSQRRNEKFYGFSLSLFLSLFCFAALVGIVDIWYWEEDGKKEKCNEPNSYRWQQRMTMVNWRLWCNTTPCHQTEFRKSLMQITRKCHIIF